MHGSTTPGRPTPGRPHALFTASGAAVAVAASLVLAVPTASASTTAPTEPTPTTYAGHVYGDGATTSPTADKPQSKLWWNDGSWWALMATATSVNIHELQPDHTWKDTGVVADKRIDSNGDALWTGGQLYVASRAEGGQDSLVSRYTYSSETRTYDLVDDSWTTVPGAAGVESVSMDRDSAGLLWLTFTKDAKVWATHTEDPSLLTFVAPFPISGDDLVSADDISAVISLGTKIGVMWSDTSDPATAKMSFAVRDDADPVGSAWHLETALSGAYLADDHVNLKSMLGDDQGRVHAAVKTSEDNNTATDGEAPSIVVLSRAAEGTWTAVPSATVADNQSRPQLALDSTNRELYVLQSDEGGGTVHYKSTSLDKIEFGPGKGTPFITAEGASINNVSTAKNPVDATTDLVAIATDSTDTARRYYHAELPIDGDVTPPPADTTPPPAPAFSPASGTYTSAQSVELSSTEADAVIRYEVGTGTTVPADPTADSKVYSGPLSVSTSSVIKARAFDAAGNAGPVQRADYTITTPPAPAPGNVLAAGKQLSSGQSLTSPNGKYRLAMQGDGNVVVYADGSRVLWHAGTSRNPGARLVMQTDGNLVAYSATDRPLWNTGTRGTARLVLQDDGNLVVYRTTDNRPLWFTGADKPAPAPVERTSTLTAGSRLVAGQQLTSSDGRYRFVMQGDGNAVVYRDSRPVWFSGTGGRPGARLILQGDGNLVLYASSGAPLWHTRTSTGARLVMQNDGNLVLYRADGRPVWFTGADRG